MFCKVYSTFHFGAVDNRFLLMLGDCVNQHSECVIVRTTPNLLFFLHSPPPSDRIANAVLTPLAIWRFPTGCDVQSVAVARESNTEQNAFQLVFIVATDDGRIWKIPFPQITHLPFTSVKKRKKSHNEQTTAKKRKTDGGDSSVATTANALNPNDIPSERVQAASTVTAVNSQHFLFTKPGVKSLCSTPLGFLAIGGKTPEDYVTLHSINGEQRATFFTSLATQRESSSHVLCVSSSKSKWGVFELSPTFFKALFGVEVAMQRVECLLYWCDTDGKIFYSTLHENMNSNMPTPTKLLHDVGEPIQNILICNEATTATVATATTTATGTNTADNIVTAAPEGLLIICKSGRVVLLTLSQSNRLLVSEWRLHTGPIRFSLLSNGHFYFGTPHGVFIVPYIETPSSFDVSSPTKTLETTQKFTLLDMFRRWAPVPLSLSVELCSLAASLRPSHLLYGLTTRGTLIAFTTTQTHITLGKTEVDTTLQHVLQCLANVSEETSKLQTLHNETNSRLTEANLTAHLIHSLRTEKTLSCLLLPLFNRHALHMCRTSIRTIIAYRGTYPFSKNWSYIMKVYYCDELTPTLTTYQIPFDGSETWVRDLPVDLTARRCIKVRSYLSYQFPLDDSTVSENMNTTSFLLLCERKFDLLDFVSLEYSQRKTNSSNEFSITPLNRTDSCNFDILYATLCATVPPWLSLDCALSFHIHDVHRTQAFSSCNTTKLRIGPPLRDEIISLSQQKFLTLLFLSNTMIQSHRTTLQELLSKNNEIVIETPRQERLSLRVIETSFPVHDEDETEAKEKSLFSSLNSSRFEKRKEKSFSIPIYELTLQSNESNASLLRAAVLSRLTTIYNFYEPTWLQRTIERLSKDENLDLLRASLMQYRDCFLRQTEELFQFVRKQKEKLLSLKNESDKIADGIIQFGGDHCKSANIKETIDTIEDLVQKCIQIYKDNRENVNAIFFF
jgi:hypothetical protein